MVDNQKVRKLLDKLAIELVSPIKFQHNSVDDYSSALGTILKSIQDHDLFIEALEAKTNIDYRYKDFIYVARDQIKFIMPEIFIRVSKGLHKMPMKNDEILDFLDPLLNAMDRCDEYENPGPYSSIMLVGIKLYTLMEAYSTTGKVLDVPDSIMKEIIIAGMDNDYIGDETKRLKKAKKLMSDMYKFNR
jgi:hypothetical protein